MSRKVWICVSMAGLLALAGSAHAGNEFNWTNGTGNQSWITSGNWDQGSVPTDAVGAEAQIDMTGADGCIVAADGDASQVLLGKYADGEMTVNSGATLSVLAWVTYLGHNAGNTGTLNMNGGTWIQDGMKVAVGNDGHGVLNMNAGLMQIVNNESICIPHPSGAGTGEVYLYGGTIEAEWFYMDADGYMDITEGTLKIRNDPGVAGYIANEWIVGYGGAGEVFHDTTTNPGWTTVWATPEPLSLVLLALGGLVGLRRRR